EEVKVNEGAYDKNTGTTVYSPESTGKIIALETAKLRRTTLEDKIITPGIEEHLDKADIMLLPRADMRPKVYKIDNSFIPEKREIEEILKLNAPYKDVIKNVYPEGLNVYVVPGYFEETNGEFVGGIFNQGNVNGGVWLNSYNVDTKNALSKQQDLFNAGLNEVKLVKPTFLRGNQDRALVLAHELGHAISIQKMDLYNDQKAEKPEKGSSLLITSNSELDFFSSWKSLRSTSKLDNTELHPEVKQSLTKEQVAAVHLSTDLEMIAEDVRMAITGDVIPTYSKLTSCYDSSEEGKQTFNNVMQFMRDVLIENKSPFESFMKINNFQL
ncbi:MAG: hypothetical protein AB7V50_09175, partial [Vampirovibrionia bacterium]